MLSLDTPNKKGDILDVRTKGVKLTASNRHHIRRLDMMKLIRPAFFNQEVKPVSMSSMTMAPNSTNRNLPYATMTTRYSVKNIQAVFSKRRVLQYHGDTEGKGISDFDIVRLLPFGYGGDKSEDPAYLDSLSRRWYTQEECALEKCMEDRGFDYLYYSENESHDSDDDDTVDPQGE